MKFLCLAYPIPASRRGRAGPPSTPPWARPCGRPGYSSIAVSEKSQLYPIIPGHPRQAAHEDLPLVSGARQGTLSYLT